MTKISKKSAYPKKTPVVNDYFVGTDSENNLKTVNFGFEETAKLINELTGTSVLNYLFKTSENIPLEVLTEGVFLSDENETSIAGITKLYVNKKNFYDTDLTDLFRFMSTNKNEFLVTLKNSNNLNKTVYFNIVGITEFETYFTFDISTYISNAAFTDLVNFNVYFFNFELKSVGGSSGSDPLKLDKSTYTGNAQDLKNEIDLKVDKVAGKGLSTEDYTTSEKNKLASIDATHYLAPLQTTVQLSALPQATISDKARVYVENELSDYFYDVTATSGDIAPNDQVGGVGFWRKVAIGGETAASIKVKYESNADTNAFTNALKAKIDSITEIFTTTLKGFYDLAYTHSQSAHAPSDAQKNSNITKAEIEAKLTGEISTHTHAGAVSNVKSIDGIPISGTGNLVSKNGFIVQSLGDIYNKTTWVDASDFTASGGASVSVSGGKIQLGTSATGSFSSIIKINNKISLLERWSIKATVKVLSNTGTSYGVGFGIDTINPYGGAGLLARFTTFPTSNHLYINNSTNNAQADDIATFSIATNDILYLELNYLGAGLVKVNLTKGTTTVSTTYQYTLTGASLPNTGQFVIKTFGGNCELQSLQIDSLENKYADLMVIGDSKTQGYYASIFANRFCDILRGTYPTVVNSGGGWDRSIEAIARIDELKSLTPKNVILHVGSNDKRSGETLANWSARFLTLKSEMESVGSTVYAMKMFNETILTFADYNSFIDSNFASNRIIDAGTISLNGDGVHPNDAGNIQIANAIKAKVSIPNPIVLPITKQVREIGTSFTLNDFDNGSVIILTSSCTVTIPNGLVAGFECTIVTLAGVTYSQTLGGSVTFTNNVGVTMAEKLSFTMKNRTAENSYLITGNL